MRALYVLARSERPTWPTPALVARAAELGCTPQVGDPTGRVPAFPSVVVTSTALATAFVADTAGQATLAEVDAAKTAALDAEAAAARQVEASGTKLAHALDSLGSGLTQGAKDTATLASIEAETPPSVLAPILPILRRMVQQEMSIGKGVAHLLVVSGIAKPTQLPPGV